MKKIFLIASVLTFIGFAAIGQDKKEANPLKDSVSAQRFIFIPNTMMPQGGGSKTITGYYEMRITKEKITCYLPYAGRAYSAGYGSSDGPLDFSITDFVYKAEPGKKESVEITISPKDKSVDARDFHLTVYENGSAYLSVGFNNRQPISFNGRVDVIKEKKKD